MQEVLERYYSFFMKNNFSDKENPYDLEKFYALITMLDHLEREDFVPDETKSKIYNYRNRYKPLKYDLDVFYEFFDMVGNGYKYEGVDKCARIKGRYSSSRINAEGDEEKLKEKFANENVSFKWFSPSPNMVIERNFIFSTKHSKESYCKAYLSIKQDKYIDVMIKLMKFIDELYKNHPDEEINEFKFRKFPANDAIVLRFAKREHYDEFLGFLNNNPEIRESFDQPNPFIPKDENGISVLPDKGGSYNKFITKVIWDYMFECREKNINVSVGDLCNFVNEYDCSLSLVAEKSARGLADEFKNILIGKLSSKPDSELVSFMHKKNVKQNN